MDNYTPHQAARIVTIQVAVSAATGIDEIADCFTGILTDAMCDTDTLVLDWQYLTPLEESPVVTLGADPDEGDAFRALADDVPACQASLELAISRTFGWWPETQGDGDE
jgi:hypothetical protein